MVQSRSVIALSQLSTKADWKGKPTKLVEICTDLCELGKVTVHVEFIPTEAIIQNLNFEQPKSRLSFLFGAAEPNRARIKSDVTEKGIN